MTTVGLLSDTAGPGADYVRRLHEGAEARGETLDTVLVTAARPAAAARACEAAGADVLALCSPALHLDAAEVRRSVVPPVLHIADAVAEVAIAEGWTRLLLLGSSRDTEGSGCLARLGARGLAAFLPDDAEQALVDAAVAADASGGSVDEVREQMTRIVTRAVFRGAHAVVHLSPAVGAVLGAADRPRSPLPVIDALEVHVTALLDTALGAVPAPASAAVTQSDVVATGPA